MSEVGDFLLNNGLAITLLIFGIWKGIPYIQNINKGHVKDIREIIDANEKERDKNVELIRQMAKESSENHQAAMRVVEANTSILTSVSSDVNELKKEQVSIKILINETNTTIKNTQNLISEVTSKLSKVD